MEARTKVAARAVGAVKSYGSGDNIVRALDGIDVEFASGEFTCIMGPSGSGKSTLMHCMAGLDSLSGGQTFIGDTDVSSLGEAELTNLRRDEAESRNLGIRDSVVLSTQLTEVTLQVVTLYTTDEVVGGLIVDVSVADRVGFQPLDSLVLISTSDTASSEPEIEAILAGDPTATVKSARAYVDDQAGQLNTLLNLLYGLLALSVIIALLGVANTMTLSIHERTRELGLLRAVGMSGPQLRSAVRSEAALIGLVGSMVGVLLGIFFCWLAHRATVETFPVFSLPWIQLIVIAIVGILAGLLAGWRPARRASELNILEAISHS